MRTPPPLRRGGALGRFNSGGNRTAFIRQLSPSPQLSPAARASAEALAEYRAAIDTWDRCHGQTPMPTPAAYGLALPSLRPSDIHWRRAA